MAKDIYGAFNEFFKKVVEADIITSKFAEAGGLEKHLKSTREVAQKFEEGISECYKGVFNLLMCYVYISHYIKQPGIARLCREEFKFYLERAKSYGIKLEKDKPLLPSSD